ncbi:MAG: site-specific integrase [Myxococcota bacterium]
MTHDRENALTLKTFAPEWLRTYAVVNNRPSEVVSKEMILRVHLIPFFGEQPLDEISAKDIEVYKATKLKPTEGKPLKAKTINNHLVVLRRLLATAEEWSLIDRTPSVRRLRPAAPSFDWLNARESRRFLRVIDTDYPQWSALFWMALRTGLRRGELFALRWNDIDFSDGSVRVVRSVYRGRLGPTKNGKERTVPMTSTLAKRLKIHRVGRGAPRANENGVVFPAANGKMALHQDQVAKPLGGALRKAGLRRMTFHALRHSFASQLVSAGRSIQEVQELLGHSSIQTTMRYAHLAPERMREAIATLEASSH